MSEVRGENQLDLLWKWSRENNRMFLVIDRRPKGLCNIHYSMRTVNFNLTERAVRQIIEILNKLPITEPGYKPYYANSEEGYYQDAPIDAARQSMQTLRKILISPENHQPLQRTYYK